MKRKNNLYNEICKMENIISVFDEVCKNTKNKSKKLFTRRHILIPALD